MKFPALSVAAAALAALAPLTSHAQIYNGNGIDFPAGDISFADEVVSQSYLPGKAPNAINSNPLRSLGAPDYQSGGSCTQDTEANPCTFTSLGSGGTTVWKFTDNLLVVNGSLSFDLIVFEVGPAVEPMRVDISKDGETWYDVGNLGGSISAIDLDRLSYGFTTADQFSYVRLTDLTPNGGGGGSAGADIDAIGAISTVSAVPEPATTALLLSGLLGLGLHGKRRRG